MDLAKYYTYPVVKTALIKIFFINFYLPHYKAQE